MVGIEFLVLMVICQLPAAVVNYRKAKAVQRDRIITKPRKLIYPSKPKNNSPEPLAPRTTGVLMVGGTARLVKTPLIPTPITKADTAQFVARHSLSSTPPPPPPPSIHSKLNPAYIIPLPKEPARPPLDIPTRGLMKLDSWTGEREVSERLVRAVALANPSRDGQWCVEKALWDIERDRQ